MRNCKECGEEINPKKNKHAVYCWRKCKKKAENRRYRKKGGFGEKRKIISLYRELAVQFLGGKCLKCGSIEELEIDHIIPFGNGGGDEVKNLQILCKKCHFEKTMNDMKTRNRKGGYPKIK